MASLVRTLAILTLPAAAIGALGGFALRAVFDHPSEPSDAPADTQGPDAEPGGDVPDVPDAPDPARTARRGRPLRHTPGEGRTPAVTRLDPSYGRRLSAADESTRLACALELLEMNPPWESVDALPISGDAATKLRDNLVNSLEALGRIQRGPDYARSPEASKLQVRLKYFGKVVPDALLVKDRRRYWEICVETDKRRTADGTVRPGEASWHTLELARAKHELREIGDDEWRRLHDAEIGAVRGWVKELAARRDVGRDQIHDVETALARLEAAR